MSASVQNLEEAAAIASEYISSAYHDFSRSPESLTHDLPMIIFLILSDFRESSNFLFLLM